MFPLVGMLTLFIKKSLKNSAVKKTDAVYVAEHLVCLQKDARNANSLKNIKHVLNYFSNMAKNCL